MSIFPTKILLATDGSKEARLAAQAAAELSKDTGSEVHVAYVLPSPRELRGHHTYSREVMSSVLEQAEGGRPVRSSRSRPSRSGHPGARLPRLTSRRESQRRRS